MRQQEVFNKIGNIIRELNEQYEYMNSAGNLFNELELELMAANAHFLSDHVGILIKLSQAGEKEVIEKSAITPSKSSTEGETSLKSTSLPESGWGEASSPPEEDLEGAEPPIVFEFDTKKINPNEVNIIYEMEPEEIIRHELVMDDDTGDNWDEEDNKGEIDLQPGPPADIIEIAGPEIIKTAPVIIKPDPDVLPPAPNFFVEEPKPAINEPQPIIPEPKVVLPEPTPIPQPKPAVHAPIPLPEEQVLTLNERMSAQLASRKADHFAAPQPINDLKSAITLNDKLLFIKDLFHGYSLAYAEAIDILNRMHTFEEAEKYLTNSYATKNNWAEKQTTAEKFYALLGRRYS